MNPFGYIMMYFRLFFRHAPEAFFGSLSTPFLALHMILRLPADALHILWINTKPPFWLGLILAMIFRISVFLFWYPAKLCAYIVVYLWAFAFLFRGDKSVMSFERYFPKDILRILQGEHY